MASAEGFLFCCSLVFTFSITCAQDFSTLSLGTEHNYELVLDNKPVLIDKLVNFNTYSEASDISEELEILNQHQSTEKAARKRRQINREDGYIPPMISDLQAAQHCHGIYLRWKRPPAPVSVTKPYTNSEFSFYNVYRSTEYFKNVNGMKPYASGKEYFGLQTLHNVSWIDRDPATNVQVWYAVTIVTRDGKEMKEVTPAKAIFIGVFGPHGQKIPLTVSAISGRTLHHSAIYNSERDEYFVAFDVDTNLDGQPDRIYALRLTPSGSIVGRNVLDVTISSNAVSQGWPSVAYNSLRSEYLIAFQFKSRVLLQSKSFIVATRVWSSSFKLVTNPAMLLNVNQNVNGKLVQVQVIKPRVIFNPLNSGYVVSAEAVGFNGKRFTAIHYSDSNLNRLKTFFAFENDARFGRLAIDTKRNDLYIMAQLPRSAFKKAAAPKLAYCIAVKKRSLSGDVLPAGEIIVNAGETRILDSSISSFYDVARDRLLVFWSDMIAGKRVIKSSRILIAGNIAVAEYMDSFQEQTCPGGNLRAPFVETFPTTTGQLVIGEKYTRRGVKLYGPLIKDDVFQYAGRDQKLPFLVANENGDQILAVWQEVISGKQSNLFARVLKAARPTCASCSAPRVCKKENTCVSIFKDKNPCASNNGFCSDICLKSNVGAKCSCKDGYKLGGNKRICNKKANVLEDMVIITASVTTIWRTRIMTDGSLQTNRLFSGISLVAVYVDEKQHLLYWSDVDASLIYRGKLDGTKREIFMSNVRSDGIYVDSDASKVFWTDFLNKRIDVANTNMQNRISLITTGIDKPRAITSCKQQGVTYLYWSDWGSPSKIERIKLNPSLNLVANRRTIVSSQIVWPNGLTADCDKNQLYWADAQTKKIEVSDLLGNRRRALTGLTLTHPFSIVTYGNSIYWSDWSGFVNKADKGTGKNEVQIMRGMVPRGVYILKGQVSCKNPGTPVNGYRNGDVFTAKSSVVFICKEGYEMKGQSQVRCQDDGSWSAEVPTCTATRCPNPAKPYNGNNVVAENKIGGLVIYTCNPGYELIGSSKRRCMPGGAWDGNQPKCMSLPVFTKAPHNETVTRGKSIIFQCDATGAGEIKIKWFKDGRPFEFTDATGRIFLSNGRLAITEAVYSDTGKFTCKASNDAGVVQADAYLRVVIKRRANCGVPKFETRHRISGGRNAGAGAHPWIAMFWNNVKKMPFCSGSLITEKFVVTAAHCLPEFKDLSHIAIRFGKMKAKEKAEKHEEVRSIKKVHRHPHFNPGTFDSDIAIIELSAPIVFTDYIIPICLPHDDSDFSLIKSGAKAMVIGWGVTSKRKGFSKRLKEVEVPIIKQNLCKRTMSKYPLTDNMFCAGGGGYGDACKGDSGGPITMKNTRINKHILVGIVSWGIGCGNAQYYGVYVRLYNFMPWINTFFS